MQRAGLKQVVGVGSWCPGLMEQAHVRLSGRAPCLSVVAGNAGCRHVLPGVGAAPEPRDDVIQGQVSTLPTTVLAYVSIADEDLSPGKAALEQWSTYEGDQADNRGGGQGQAWSMDLPATIYQQLRLPSVYQHHSHASRCIRSGARSSGSGPALASLSSR